MLTLEITRAVIWDLFLFSILSCALAGLVCPLVGCFLLVRRTGFYGITLPQFATAGVACGFAVLPWWIARVGLGGMDLETALDSPHALMNYHLGWAAFFTFLGLLALGTPKRGAATETARMAASFSIASALAILFGQFSPTGMEYVEVLLRGEALIVDVHKFETIAGVYGAVLVLFLLFHRDLLIASYDPETATVLGKRVRRWDALLLAMTGAVVAVGVWVVGPIVLFGLLVIPPLAARSLARSMTGFYGVAAALGVVAAYAGAEFSFFLDWPLGPSVVAVAAAELVPCWAIGRLRASR